MSGGLKKLLLPVGLIWLGGFAIVKTEFQVVGAMMWVIAWLLVIWSVVRDWMIERGNYLSSVADVLRAAEKNDIEKIAALGFVVRDAIQSVKVEVVDKRDGGNTSKYGNVKASPEQLRQFANGVLMFGEKLGYRRWSGVARPWKSRGKYDAFMDSMCKCGLARMVDQDFPNLGYVLNDEGRDFLKAYLPSPTGEMVQYAAEAE